MSARDVIAKFIRPYTLNDKELPALVAEFYSTLESAGYVVVPKEPTADMLVEGNLVIARNRLFATEIYKAMLTAAKETK